MNKLKTIFGVSLLWFALHVSCDGPPTDPCGESRFPSSFDVQGYSVFLTNQTFGAPVIDTTSIFAYDSIAIRTIPVIDYLYAKTARQSSFGIQKAYACTPAIPYSIDTLSEITVIANVDYDSNFVAGESLNPIIMANFIDDRVGPMEMPLADFLNSRPSVKRDMYLRLDVPPDHLGQFRFTVQVKHVNGEEFQHLTSSVTIKP